jgi:hypothetical protein
MFILIRWDVKREREDSTLIHEKNCIFTSIKMPGEQPVCEILHGFSFASKNSDSFLYPPCGAHTQLGKCTTLCSQCNARMLCAQSQKVWRCITLRYSYFNHIQGEISIRDAKSDMRTAEMHYYYIIFINSPAEAAAFLFVPVWMKCLSLSICMRARWAPSRRRGCENGWLDRELHIVSTSAAERGRKKCTRRPSSTGVFRATCCQERACHTTVLIAHTLMTRGELNLQHAARHTLCETCAFVSSPADFITGMPLQITSQRLSCANNYIDWCYFMVCAWKRLQKY